QGILLVVITIALDLALLVATFHPFILNTVSLKMLEKVKKM
ncbi:13356_t:CDS:1, partial [Rhizophagus irregularis]